MNFTKQTKLAEIGKSQMYKAINELNEAPCRFLLNTRYISNSSTLYCKQLWLKSMLPKITNKDASLS